MLKISDKINLIEEKKRELENLRPIKPEYLAKIREKFKLEYNYYSNHLEGNTLTLGETRSLILHSYLAAIDKKLKDINEMKAHIEAYEELGFLQDKILTPDHKPLELSQYFLKNLHKKIFVEDEKRKVEEDGIAKFVNIPAGDYKNSSNIVRTVTGEIFYYPEPELVPAMMTDLLDWYNQKRNDFHPVILASVFHYKFIRIHPFGDANGRMARLLMNLILQSSGYLLAFIKSDLESKSKNRYLQALAKTDQNFLNLEQSLHSEDLDLFEPFILEIADTVLESADIMIRGAKGEDISQTGDILKQFQLELKLKKAEKDIAWAGDRFWLRQDSNLLELIQTSLVPTLTQIEDFCFILAEENFAQMNSQASFSANKEFFEKLYLSNIENNIKTDITNLIKSIDSTITNNSNHTELNWDSRVAFLFNGSLRDKKKTRNPWQELSECYQQNQERWKNIDKLAVKYSFEGFYLERSKSLELQIEFNFEEFDWNLSLNFAGNDYKQSFKYGSFISQGDLANCLTFLVTQAKNFFAQFEQIKQNDNSET